MVKPWYEIEYDLYTCIQCYSLCGDSYTSFTVSSISLVVWSTWPFNKRSLRIPRELQCHVIVT